MSSRNKRGGNFTADLFGIEQALDSTIYALDEMAGKVITSNKYYVGIDNGISGTVAIISPDNKIFFEAVPTKSEQSYTKTKQNITRINAPMLIDMLMKQGLTIDNCRVVIERPMVNPTRFKASASGLRALEAVLIVVDDMLHLPFSYIDSREWQKALLPKGINGDELKAASLQIGNRLFPQVREMKHKDRDGLLIAEYARRIRL